MAFQFVLLSSVASKVGTNQYTNNSSSTNIDAYKHGTYDHRLIDGASNIMYFRASHPVSQLVPRFGRQAVMISLLFKPSEKSISPSLIFIVGSSVIA